MADVQRKETAEGSSARSGNLALRSMPGTMALVAIFVAGVAVCRRHVKTDPQAPTEN
jgi:hypothetical protein